MKKRLFALTLVLALLLTACGTSGQAQETTLDADEILLAMAAAAPEPEDSYTIYNYGEEDSLVMLELFYAIDRADLADAAFAQANGASAFELAVFRLTDGADKEAAVQHCQNRLQDRAGDFSGYAPDQSMLASDGLVLSAGQWVALVISQDAEAVRDAFSGCFRSDVESTDAGTLDSQIITLPDGSLRIAYVDPEIDDMTLYDTSAILAAWQSGDTSSLSEKDSAILSAAKSVLGETVTDNMSDYEKELAVYSWLARNLRYDYDHQNDPLNMDPDSGNPYGGLMNHKAICLGFATTFQLLMDLADVECITVVGAAFSSREDHAWNMVRLDGEWYCVDVTWDVGCPPEYFGYFNVTSEIMYHTDHQWDYASVPEATATDGGKP